MKLFDYKNLRTGQTHEGAPSRSNKNCLSLRAQTVPDILPGDVLTLPSGQRALTVEIDHTGISCPRPRLRHCKVRIAPVSGLLSVSRVSAEVNDFGRAANSVEGIVLNGVPTHLADVQEIFPAGGPEGFSQVFLRYVFLIAAPSPVLAGDSAIYSVDGIDRPLRVIGAWHVAATLQQVRCTAG